MERRLKYLGYPYKIPPNNTIDIDFLKTLVIWLGENKIKLYSKKKSEKKIQNLKKSEFMHFFYSYLLDLKCPFLENKKNLSSVTDFRTLYNQILFLINKAIKYNNVYLLIKKIASLLNLPINVHKNYNINLISINYIVQERLSKSLNSGAVSCNSGTLSCNSGAVPCNSGTLSCNNGVPDIKQMLQLLYINDLHQYQLDINNILLYLQKLSFNVKINSNLGLVGY